MENKNQDITNNNEFNENNHQEPKVDNSYYQPNFYASFTEPVRPERRQNVTNENPTYAYYSYNNQDAGPQMNYNTYSPNNQYENEAPKKTKKKRTGLKIAIGIFAAVFLGFGSYGVYDHFFVKGNDSSLLSDNNSEQKNDNSKENSNANKDTQGALSEDNSGSDVVIQQTTVTDVNKDNSVVTVSENTQPSIVAINSTITTSNGWGQSYEQLGSGSGIILKQTDTTLLIVTNNHVVESASNIDVVFTDGQSVPAKVKGTDSTSDLAVIEVKLSDIKDSTLKSIKVATLGSSSDLKVGEMVVAIGNALGYGQSVTVGYISAKDREVTIDNKKMILLQTDAAINPGNSGGALLNLNGEVIGINSAKFSSEVVEGIGYAIPISNAIPIINELVDREVLKEEEKGYIGISGTTVTDEMHNSLNYPYGVYVSEVAKDGAAEIGGIKPYDILTKLNGNTISTIEGFKERLNSYRAGTQVEITLQRIENGAYVEKTLKITLQDKKVLDSLQSGAQPGNTEDNSANNNGDSTNPYGEDGRNNSGDSYGLDEWPWSLFE